MRQLTKEEAVKMSKDRLWESWSARRIAEFQLYQERLCMPFDVFHKAVEKVLDRSVYTHEFALNYDGLKAELEGRVDPPTLEQILDLIPEEKRAVTTILTEDPDA